MLINANTIITLLFEIIFQVTRAVILIAKNFRIFQVNIFLTYIFLFFKLNNVTEPILKHAFHVEATGKG